MKIITTREITRKECPWLEANIVKGTILYKYNGYTYGVIGNGRAVSVEKDVTPFFEIPKNSYEDTEKII